MKKLLACAAVAALILTGCSKDLEVEAVKYLEVEYGDTLDNSKLFDAKKSDEGVKVDKVEGFDSKKIGKQELTVTFADGDKTVDEKITVEVKDTKKPEIVLKKETVTITVGDKLEVKDNIKSVKDPVDGDLKYSDKSVEKDGFYIDKSKLNAKKTGTYEIKVIAKDKNGNSIEKSFKVKVEEKKVASTKNADESSNEPSSNNNTVPANGGNGNTGGGKNITTPSSNSASSNSGASNQKPSNTNGSSSTNNKPNRQDPNKITRPLGNTGWVGSEKEVTAKAYAAATDPNSQWSVFNGWDGWRGWNLNESMTLWTVEFYKKR